MLANGTKGNIVIPKQIDHIEKPDIDALIANGVAEGRTLDFKEVLPGNSDGDKKELLADVSSFANASGGDLVFGVAETGGVAVSAPGLGGIDKDAETLRLDSCIRNGIEPRIPGVQIRAIDGFPNGPVLLVRLPRSWASPHMVTFKGTSRFFTRNNAGKHQMDVGDIRAAFALSESIPERIRNFRTDRLGKIVANETSFSLLPSAKLVMHLLPVESFAQSPVLDVRALTNHSDKLLPLALQAGSEWDSRLNLDGLMTFEMSSEKECLAYTQLFRKGQIETVDCALLHPNEDGSRTIPATDCERELLKALRSFLKFQKAIETTPPVAVLVSMIGVRDYQLDVPRSKLRPGSDWNRVDRETLIFPDVLIEDFDQKPDAILRPVFDAIWQSAGFPGSPNFDDQHNWTGR